MDGPMTNADLRTMGYPLAGERSVHPVGPRALVETMLIPDSAPHAELLRAARDKLCAQLVGQGFTPVLSTTWGDLEALNRANLGSWLPLMRRPDGSDWFWLGAVDTRGCGDVVATHGAVLVDCGPAT